MFVKGDAIVFQYTQITIKHIVTDAITNGKIEKDSSFVETKLLSIIPFDSSRRTISERSGSMFRFPERVCLLYDPCLYL